MRFRLILAVSLLFASFLSVKAQQKINQLDTNFRKQGVWRKTYPNGKIRYEGQFVDDVPVGLFKYYYESGELKSTAYFSNQGKKSFTVTYYQNGKKWSEGNYVEEKKDSVWKFYDKFGNIQTEETYKNGVKEGPATVYYDNGNISATMVYKQGKKNGPYKEFFPSGKLKLSTYYVDDERNGEFLVNYPSELPFRKGRYERSLPEGWWETYNPDGELQVREFFVKGVSKKIEYINGKFEDYYPSQIPKEVVTYKNGKKNGPFIEFYDVGTFKKVEQIDEKSGEKNVYEYLEGQVPKRKGNYLDDKLDGEIIYFDINGKILKKEFYKNGEKQN